MGKYSMPCRQIEALQKKAQVACKLFIDECKKQGLKVLVTQTLRTAEYQNELYQQGRTKPGNIVTNLDGYNKKSPHQSGYAWDICKNVKGQEYSDKEFFKKAGAIAKKYGIVWGGTWTSFVDEPHFEIDSKWVEPTEEKANDTIEIMLNGKLKRVETIAKDGNNFIKLRDLADEKIDIGYDKVAKRPIVIVRG